jgi:predicted dehydrogenase
MNSPSSILRKNEIKMNKFLLFLQGSIKRSLFFALVLLPFTKIESQTLRVAIAGLSHDHANNIMHQYQNGEVQIIGIAESNKALADRYKNRFHLPDSIFYSSLSSMLDRVRPDAVLAYNAIVDHLAVVEACAPRGISVMVEKPLATTVEQAERIAVLARQYHILVLTNYETTWYPSNQKLYELVHEKNEVGNIRKMVVHMGHQGPKEIGCSPDFLEWLTDPVKNGGGALTDFGCYGANLMTWLMNGQAPIAVTAVTRHIKPSIYPHVDDDATIILEYRGATGIIEASWNWPFGIKDLEVFGDKAYLHALNGNKLEKRGNNSPLNDTGNINLIPPVFADNLSYLAAALKGLVRDKQDLNSLENNLIVVKILDAARRSSLEGRRIKW